LVPQCLRYSDCNHIIAAALPLAYPAESSGKGCLGKAQPRSLFLCDDADGKVDCKQIVYGFGTENNIGYFKISARRLG
jgi:hypothetical protein